MPPDTSGNHEIEIEMSPAVGNYGSTMFEDRHRQSFEDSCVALSPNPGVENQPTAEFDNKEVITGEIDVAIVHDDIALLNDAQATISPLIEEQKVPQSSNLVSADNAENEAQE